MFVICYNGAIFTIVNIALFFLEQSAIQGRVAITINYADIWITICGNYFLNPQGS